MSFDMNLKDFIWNYPNLHNVSKFFCRYVGWMDDMQICYIGNNIYKNCNKCPFNYRTNMLVIYYD